MRFVKANRHNDQWPPHPKELPTALKSSTSGIIKRKYNTGVQHISRMQFQKFNVQYEGDLILGLL